MSVDMEGVAQALYGRPSSAPVLDICPLPGHMPPVTNPRLGQTRDSCTRRLFSGEGACVQEGGKCRVPAPTVQSLRHALRVNRHTRPSALVDLVAGSPWRGVAYSVYRPTFRGHPASSAAAYLLPSANRVEPCPPLNM